MKKNDKKQKVLLFVEKEFEDLELLYPRYRLIEAGFEPVVAGPKAKEQYAGKHGCPCVADISFADVNSEDFCALIIPGGHAPDHLRIYPKVLEIVKQFHQLKKPIAFICHAGWVPASAGILKGVKCTSVKNIKDDLVNAGANWIDEAVVIDGHFITSRTPDDLPAFGLAIVNALKN